MTVGASLFITARIQPGRYNANRIETSIGKIDFLSDIKDQLIESITITASLANLNDDIVLSLSELIDNSPGNAALYFQIIDPEGHMNLTLRSRSKQVSVRRELIEYIQGQTALAYRIN